MATRDQVRELLAVSCGWCHAAVGEPCSTMGRRRGESAEGRRASDRRPIRTLDGGAHDARWKRALDEPAPVLTAVVREEHMGSGQDREPLLVGATTEDARPW